MTTNPKEPIIDVRIARELRVIDVDITQISDVIAHKPITLD